MASFQVSFLQALFYKKAFLPLPTEMNRNFAIHKHVIYFLSTVYKNRWSLEVNFSSWMLFSVGFLRISWRWPSHLCFLRFSKIYTLALSNSFYLSCLTFLTFKALINSYWLFIWYLLLYLRDAFSAHHSDLNS